MVETAEIGSLTLSVFLSAAFVRTVLAAPALAYKRAFVFSIVAVGYALSRLGLLAPLDRKL